MQIKHTFLLTLILGLAWTGYLFAYVLGPDPAQNGIFGVTQNCMTGCHTGNPINAPGGSVSVGGLPADGWVPSQNYPLTVTIQRSGQRIFGFQLSAVNDATNQQAGTLVAGTRAKVICGVGTNPVNCTVPGAVQYAEHSDARVPTSTYNVSWTAPSSPAVGIVRFNVAGNAANGDGSNQGDFIYTAIERLAPAVQTVPLTTFYFPQIADGVQDASVSWKTTVFITNPAAAGSPPANGTITFTTSLGAAFNVAFVDENGVLASSGNRISFTVAPGESRKFVSTAAAALTVGFATVTADALVKGTALFSEFAGGALFAEAGVSSADAVTRQTIFVDAQAGFTTGVAYANPNSTPATISLQLLGSTGSAVVAATTQTLGANQHNSVFVNQLFPGTPAFTGTMQITSPTSLAAVALRFAPSGIFTTLPPVTLASLISPLIDWAQRRAWLAPLASSLARFLSALHFTG